jgi:alpha-L-fucosidase 2
MNEVLRRDFPLSRPEVGMLLANGTIGAMIWGQDNRLCITLNRSDFWLHKGGLSLSPDATYTNIRKYIEANDTAKLAGLFEPVKNATAAIVRPTLLPLGRIDLTFPKDAVFKTGYLHLKNGKVVIDITDSHGTFQISCTISMDKPLVNIHFPPARETRGMPKISCVSAWEYASDKLSWFGLERPAGFDEPGFCGWVQKRPGDQPICVGAAGDKGDIYIALRYSDSPENAKDRVRKMLEKAKKTGSDPIRTASATFWANHWRWVPHVEIPNETLSFLYYFGTFIFASLTTTTGVVPTAHGPWVDEKGEVPYVGSFRGFINLRMSYWPAFRTNLMRHCKDLFTMIDSWKETMRENARRVFGIDDGVLLPCTVDDQCTRLGGTWGDIINPGNAAAVAELMYRHYLYTQDIDFLRTTAYPFMVSAMRVYEAVLEKQADGAWSLPLSVSPVLRGAMGSRTGKNANFQLACVHFLCESLQASAAALGEVPKPLWAEIGATLPKFALCETRDNYGRLQKELGVFENVPLDESDALHSHLAGLCPFDTLDIENSDLLKILEETVETWVCQGMGAWNTTSLPWASMIHTRLKNADMAELILEIWERVFMNEGDAAVRDPLFMGFSTRGTPESAVAGMNEVLHMDAHLGATAAILEMLLCTRRGVNYLFSGAPQRWKNVSFDNIRTEGAFEVGATRRNGRVMRVSIKANAPGVFRLSNPWGGKVSIQRAKATTTAQGPLLEISCVADERVELSGE